MDEIKCGRASAAAPRKAKKTPLPTILSLLKMSIFDDNLCLPRHETKAKAHPRKNGKHKLTNDALDHCRSSGRGRGVLLAKLQLRLH